MRKLKVRSSIKSLQEAITCLNPVGPICIQESKTNSFRVAGDLHSASHHALFSTPSSSSSSTSIPAPLQLQEEEEEEKGCHTATATAAASSVEPTDEADSIPKGSTSTHRFFYSPRTTKSIMEDAKAERSGRLAAGGCGFLDESVRMAVASYDPYGDFRASMEEMVEAHGVREWPRLEELLHCYLRLNDRKTHGVIVLAFIDLLARLKARPG